MVRLSGGNELHCAVDATVAAAGDKMTLGIRPEHICLDAGTNTIEAEVAFVESLGSTTHAYCAYPGTDDLTLVLIGAGIPLFGPLDADLPVRHLATRVILEGAVQSEYALGD